MNDMGSSFANNNLLLIPSKLVLIPSNFTIFYLIVKYTVDRMNKQYYLQNIEFFK